MNGRMNRRLVVPAIVVAILAVVGIGYAIQSQRDTTGEATGASMPMAAADTYGLGLGNPQAPVKIEIFEDFLCPFCHAYEEAGRDRLHELAAAGQAYVVYRPIAFLNEYSARALNAFAVVL